MGLLDSVYHLLGRILMERPARDQSVAELIAQLEESGEEAAQQLAVARDSQKNRGILRHVIGIERWGQRRLQVALGAPYVADELNDYVPPADDSWSQLHHTFAGMRQETLSIADQIREEGVNGDRTIRHNQWGDLSVRAWLYYLNFHAEKDIKTLQG